MADALWTTVRLLHIGSGIFLVGGATLWNMVVMPTLAQLGPTLPKGAMPTLGARILKVLPHTALLTLITGALLYYGMMDYGRASPIWNMLMGLALVVMLVNVVLAFGLLKPTFKKLGQAAAAAQGPPTPEMQALMAKMKTYGIANLALAWLIVVLMVVGTAVRTT